MKFHKGDIIDGYCESRQKMIYNIKVENVGDNYLGCTDLDGNRYYAILMKTAKPTITNTKLYKALK